MADLFTKISQSKPSMRPAQAKIADFVLDKPEEAANSTIAELAKHVGISTASVVRFCDEIGYSSFTDFRLAVSVLDLHRYGYRPFVNVNDQFITRPAQLAWAHGELGA